MKQKLKWDNTIGILLWAVSIVLLGISVFLSFSGDIWYDELFTMGLVKQPLGKLISITARDVHPPLYYLLLKIFCLPLSGAKTDIFVQTAAAKLFSTLPFFFCLILGITKVRKHFGMLSAGLFSFLLLSMPQLAGYTVEVRMYGWGLFFITAGMLQAYELTGKSSSQLQAAEETLSLLKKQRMRCFFNWMLLTIYSLAACYTHYFACVAACMIYLYLLAAFLMEHRLKKEIKAYLLSGLTCAAGYLPWLLSAVRFQVGQVSSNYWIQPLSWRTLGGCIKFLFMPSFTNEKLNIFLAVVLFLLYSALLLNCLWRLRKGQEKSREIVFLAGGVFILAGVVGFGFLISFLLRPIFVYRYMLPAAGVFWLVFSIFAARLKEKKYLYLPVLFLLLIVGIRNYRAFYGEEMWKKLQMAEFQKEVAQIEKEDILIFNFEQMQAVAAYYLDNESYLWYSKPETLFQEMYPQMHALVEEEFSDEEGIRRMRELLAEYGQIWFLGSGNARDEIIQKWEAAGMKVEEKTSLMIERYWFNLYKINE